VRERTFCYIIILMVLGVFSAIAIMDNLPDQPEPPAVTLHIEENVFGALCKACPGED